MLEPIYQRRFSALCLTFDRNKKKKNNKNINRIVDLGRENFARPKDRLMRNGTIPKLFGVILYTVTVIKIVLIVTYEF